MLRHSSGNRDLFHSDAQRLHQFKGIVIGAVGGAKAWHSNAVNVLAVIAQTVVGTRCHHERKCGVDATRHAYHKLVDVRVLHATHETLSLDIHYFVTTTHQARFLLRHKRQATHRAQQIYSLVVGCLAQSNRHHSEWPHAAHGVIGKTAVHATLVVEGIKVDVGHLKLSLQTEALPFFQHLAILGYHCIAGKDKVGRRFAITGR